MRERVLSPSQLTWSLEKVKITKHGGLGAVRAREREVGEQRGMVASASGLEEQTALKDIFTELS